MPDIVYPNGSGITAVDAAGLRTNDFVVMGSTVAGAAAKTQFSEINKALGGFIFANTTLYVATTGSDTTGDGSLLAPWQTLTYALSRVRPYRIQPGVTVTIQLNDGSYSITESITNLPTGVVIQGKNVITTNITSIQDSSGTSGNYSVVVNVGEVTGIALTDYVNITAASGGTNPSYLCGCWDVTNVDTVNNRLTLASTQRGGAPSGAVTATVTACKTDILAVGVNGVMGTSVTLKNLVIRGDNTIGKNGVTCIAPYVVTLDGVGLRTFGGVGVNVTTNGQVTATACAVSGNGGHGIAANTNGQVTATACAVSGNGGYGIAASRHGQVNASALTCAGNAQWGLFFDDDGDGYAPNATIAGNTSGAVYASSYSYVNVVWATLSGTVSPALNTQGNEYAYIDY